MYTHTQDDVNMVVLTMFLNELFLVAEDKQLFFLSYNNSYESSHDIRLSITCTTWLQFTFSMLKVVQCVSFSTQLPEQAHLQVSSAEQ